MSQKSDAGPLAAAILRKNLGSRCSNTAIKMFKHSFRTQVGPFLFGHCKPANEIGSIPKKQSVMKGAAISFAILDVF